MKPDQSGRRFIGEPITNLDFVFVTRLDPSGFVSVFLAGSGQSGQDRTSSVAKMGPPTKKGGTIKCIDVEGGKQSVTCTGPINLKEGKAYVCLTGLSQEDKNTLVNLFKEYGGHKIEIDNGAG